jgi:ribonuclease D
LSDSCLNLLGKPLRKEEQVSDWDLRPLTQTQEHYAALDAHSLLGLFVAMTDETTLHPHYPQQIPLIASPSSPIPPTIWTQYLSHLNK